MKVHHTLLEKWPSFLSAFKKQTLRDLHPHHLRPKKPPLSIPRELPLPNPCIFWLDVSYIHEHRCVNMLCNAKDFVSNCVAWRILGSFPPKKSLFFSFAHLCLFFLSHRIYPPPLERPLRAFTFSPPFQSLFFYAAKVSPRRKREREREEKRRKGHEHTLSAASVARSEP